MELLQRFRSLHDALAEMDRANAFERSLGPIAFERICKRLGILDVCVDDLLKAIDATNRGTVTLAELHHAMLAEAPSEVFLWELRCRLIAAGIRPHNSHKALARLLRDPKRRRAQSCVRTNGGLELRSGTSFTQRGMAEAKAAAAARKEGAQHIVKLNSHQWLRLCRALGLTLLEAERLCQVFGETGSTGGVDLDLMFDALRCSVAPDVSIERFSRMLFARFGSISAAIAAVKARNGARSEIASAPQNDGEVANAGDVSWTDFHALAAMLDVSDRSATSLWEVLVREIDGERRACRALSQTIREHDLVQQLEGFAPDTALEVLRGQIIEHFASMGQCRRALSKQGLGGGTVLSPSLLSSGLQSVGIKCCNAGRILDAVSNWRYGSVTSSTSLGDVFWALHALPRGGGGKLRAVAAVVEDTTPLWQQLKAVQTDLRRGLA